MLLVSTLSQHATLTLKAEKVGRKFVATTVYVPANGATDVCAYLQVDKDTAKKLVLESAEYWRFYPSMILVDPSETPVTSPLPDWKEGVEPPLYEEGPHIAPVVEQQPQQVAAPSNDIVDTVQAEDKVHVENPTVLVADDAVPSTKWSKDRLFAYAKEKGLSVTDDMSKNALLRKIRGV